MLEKEKNCRRTWRIRGNSEGSEGEKWVTVRFENNGFRIRVLDRLVTSAAAGRCRTFHFHSTSTAACILLNRHKASSITEKRNPCRLQQLTTLFPNFPSSNFSCPNGGCLHAIKILAIDHRCLNKNPTSWTTISSRTPTGSVLVVHPTGVYPKEKRPCHFEPGVHPKASLRI